MDQKILEVIKETQPFGRLQTPYSALKAYAACMCFSLRALGESDENIIAYFNESLPSTFVDRKFVRNILDALKTQSAHQSLPFSEQPLGPEADSLDNLNLF